MRPKLFALIALLLTFIILPGNSENFSLSFNKENFTFKLNSNGYVEISTVNYVSAYLSNNLEPALPYIPINIRIPDGKKISDFGFSTSKSLICRNKMLSPTPIQLPTNSFVPTIEKKAPNYSEKFYPKENVILAGVNNVGNITIASFLVCPFIYESSEQNLYLTENITFDITYSDESLSIQKHYDASNISNLDINNTILNPLNISTKSNASLDKLYNGVDSIDYIIITNTEMSESFKDIAYWKNIKGVRTEIVTIEEITKAFPNTCTQFSIKDYLYQIYKNNGLKYVLLGGDDTVVPTLGCYAYFDDKTNYTDMPTDMFYACFDKNFYWNANNNSIYGECDDEISMFPNIYVTRLPVRTSSDVAAYTEKLLQYEKSPNDWRKEILMAGNSLWGKNDTICSDAERKGDRLYTNYISEFWNGKKVKFYDTNTDFTGGSKYELNIEHFQEQLQQGYPFINMITHGHPYAWKLENNVLYTTKQSNQLQSAANNTIITTNACLTNAFDHYVDWEGNVSDPCLSESFIRNRKSGVLAYFGSSREGIDISGYAEFGVSSKYIAEFYKALFSNNIMDKNFGVIATAAKIPFATISANSLYYRFIQFGLNPVGDAEMPIYTEKPIEFSRCHVNFSVPYRLNVILGTDGCNICASSKEGAKQKYYKVFRNTDHATFENVHTDLTICVTKQNYVPKIINFKFPTGKNSIIQCSNDGHTLNVVTQLEESVSSANLKISSFIGKEENMITIIKNDEECQADISDLPKGIHHVSLFVNGKLVDSINFIKK